MKFKRICYLSFATTMMKPLIGLLLLAVGLAAHEGNLDNSIVGDPVVQCGTDSILVGLRTVHTFTGRLYVDGESERPGCSQSHVKTPSHGLSTEFRIKFGECNMRRQRLLNPRGVAYSFTLVASFHPLFVTGLDRAFHIRCFFTEAVKAVESTLDVRKLTTQIIQREFSLPQCTYQLREGFSGPPIRFASVGAPVTHVWQCDDLAGLVYGILIHSCYVDDGHGNRFALIDDRGCAIDRFLLRDLSYGPEAISAHVDSHVFKYADRVQLFFTCTVQLCFKDDGGCDGITVGLSNICIFDRSNCSRPNAAALGLLIVVPASQSRHLGFIDVLCRPSSIHPKPRTCHPDSLAPRNIPATPEINSAGLSETVGNSLAP